MTANQQYKASESELPFKEWLKEEQKIGNLTDFKNPISKRQEIIMVNKPNNKMLHFLGLASIGFLCYGLTRN